MGEAKGGCGWGGMGGGGMRGRGEIYLNRGARGVKTDPSEKEVIAAAGHPSFFV